MSVINEVILAVIGLMNAIRPAAFAPVTRGALPTNSGITCEIDPSTTQYLHMDKNTVVPLGLVINGKHPNLQTLSDTLNTIHAELTRAKEYPDADRWEIIDISTYTLPRLIGREDNNDWLMASSLSVQFYWRG